MNTNTDRSTHTLTCNSWELFKQAGWEAANNTLDTLLYQELTRAVQRRQNEDESLTQSAWTIRDNMLNHMDRFTEFGARDSDPELLLVNHICSALNLPAGHIKKFYKDRTVNKQRVY